jgi:hypothetical protein
MWCYACSWDVRGDFTLNSMAQIHTSVTLLTTRDLTRRKQSDRSVNLRRRIQCQIASYIQTARVTSHELTWREDSVSPALEAHPSVVFFISQYDWGKRTEVSETLIFIIVFNLRMLKRILIEHITMTAVPIFKQFVQQIFLNYSNIREFRLS